MKKLSYFMAPSPADVDAEPLWPSEIYTPMQTRKWGAARLIGLGFRAWMRGLQCQDCRFFEICNRHYIERFGLKDGMILATKLGNWVNSIDKMKARAIHIGEPDAEGFSTDEVMAISMIAACQHAQCPALKACLYAITENSELNSPEYASRDFAEGLIDVGEILPSDCITFPLTTLTPPEGVGAKTNAVI